MKKILLIFTLFLSVLSYSQTKDEKLEEIGSCKVMGTKVLTLYKFNDDYVQFNYLDMKFSKIINYKSFFIKKTDLEEVYSLFTDFSNIEDGEVKTVALEDGEKLIFNYKQIKSKMTVKVTHIDSNRLKGELEQLSNKQVNKVFGKSK